MATSDKHIALAVLFDVPDGEDTAAVKKKFLTKTKAGTKGCLYYGFAGLGNKVICREGYKDAVSFLTHCSDIKEELTEIIKKVGKERVIVSSSSEDILTT